MGVAFKSVLGLHVAAGFLGLAAFWVAAVARKRKGMHVWVGRVFACSGNVVAGSAMGLALLTAFDPLGTHYELRPRDPERAAIVLRQFSAFLAYLGIVTFVSVRHGVTAMIARREPQRVRTRFHTVVNALCVLSSGGIFARGAATGQWLFLALSPIGLLQGMGALRYARREPSSRMTFWYEHMGGMLGAGIAFHTASWWRTGARSNSATGRTGGGPTRKDGRASTTLRREKGRRRRS